MVPFLPPEPEFRSSPETTGSDDVATAHLETVPLLRATWLERPLNGARIRIRDYETHKGSKIVDEQCLRIKREDKEVTSIRRL